jgi:hypothetical protein
LGLLDLKRGFSRVAEAAPSIAVEASPEEAPDAGRGVLRSADQSGSRVRTNASVSGISSPMNGDAPVSIS